MKRFIIITTPKNEYLGRAFLTKEKDIKIEAEEKERLFLKEVIDKITEEGARVRQGMIEKKEGKRINITYLSPADKGAPFYLEAIAEELKNRGLGALILDEKRAQLYILIKQSRSLAPDQKDKIIRNIRSFPEKEADRLIGVLTKEKEGIKKIEKEYEDTLKESRKHNEQKWEGAVAKEKKRIIGLINQKLKEK